MADGSASVDIDVAEMAARFGEELHVAGVPSTPDGRARFAAATLLARPRLTRELYWLARVTLISDHAQLGAFDAVFDRVFAGRHDPVDDVARNLDVPPAARSSPGAPVAGDASRPGGAGAAGAPAATAEGSPVAEALQVTASDVERLRPQAFGDVTLDELAQLRALVARLRVVAPSRRGRRTRPAASGRHVDLRSSLRRAYRTGGDPVRLVRRARVPRPRRVVLIADVSGSMEAYGRTYLYLLHGAARAIGAEAFVFATRLHRLTRLLASATPEPALRRAMSSAPDWSGGTRIGEALRAFNDGWGRRGVARGAVVVVVSDGWDGGDPALVAREMERLSRLAHRIVWVNPRASADGYAPLVGGMAAALPFVDAFVSGHSLAAMDDVLTAIAHP